MSVRKWDPARAWRWLSASDGPMGHKVLRGGFWLTLGDGASRLLALVKITILARLLAPHDFGLMGIAVLCLSWFEYFTQTGFSAALIYRSADIRAYLDTFWTVQVIRAALLSVVIFFAAPLGGVIFGNVEVTPLIRAIAIVTLIRGFYNPAVVYLRKELQLFRDIIWRSTAVAVGVAVAIPLAFIYRNVWALVVSTIASSVAEALLSYWAVRYRPRFAIDWGKVREMAQYGKWIFWSNIVYYASAQADSWIVGAALGPVPLGYYQIAQQTGMTPLVQIGGNLSTIMFSAFAKVKNGGDLRGALLHSVRLFSVVLLPLAVVLTILAPFLVTVILGPRWLPAGPIVQVIIWAGVLVALGGITNAFLQAVGRPELPARALLFKVIAFGLLVYPLMSKWGLFGVGVAVLLSCPVNTLYQFHRIARIIKCGPGLARAICAGCPCRRWLSVPGLFTMS